jgi:CRP/FNR family cyclic AMP-dependent transcriptional regulator
MADNMKLQALCASALATDLSEDECRVLADLVEVRDLGDGEVLVGEGMGDDRLHVIASGTLGIVKNADTDARATVATLDAGELAGELGFIDGALRQSSLVAKGSTRVLSLEREKLESLLTTHPVIVYHVMRAIIRTVHHIQRRLSLQAVELSNYVYKQHGRY